MQQTGCLKKRRKRNLTKVAGLTVTPYDEASDTFRGFGFYDSNESSNNLEFSSSRDSASITMSRIYQARRNGSISSSTRITRDPHFLMDDNYDGSDSEIPYETNAHSKKHIRSNGVPIIPTKTAEALSRPNLLDKTVMRRLYQLVTLGLVSCSFPWFWNKKKAFVEKFNPTQERIWNIIWFFLSLQMWFVFGFQIYSFYNRVSDRKVLLTYREIFMGSFSLYWYGLNTSFNWNLYLHKESIRQYINTMLDMNKKFCEKYLVDIEGYEDGGRILINVSIPSNCSQILASVALFLVMPDKPWYMYTYIYHKDNPWWWLIPGAIQELIMTGQVITSYCLIPWIVVAHTNSVDFWLKEIQSNDTGYTIPEIREPKTAIDIYKTLQILCANFNACMSPLAIPIFKTATFTGIIPCGYVLIRSMNNLFIEEFPGILTYPIGVIDLATAGVAMLSMGAEMHDLGIGFVDSWSRTKQKDFRRILKSLPALKVKVGDMYYITVSTIITFFRTCTDYIIDCIMTFP